MTNTSASGGYIQPAAAAPLPGDLTFLQFLNTVFVGISALPGDLVRPKWQPNPPKQPDLGIDWMAFALTSDDADTNAYVDVDSNGGNVFQRMEALEIQCSFYGPNSYEICKLTRDGFQIPQNLEALKSANMGFVNTSRVMHIPDLVNERWIDRYEMSVFLRREILRSYPVLTFLSFNGILKANTSEGVQTVAIVAQA